MYDAFATADLIAADLAASPLQAAEEKAMMDVSSLGGRVVSWEEWERIDREERRRGESRGKVREKMTSVQEMLAFLE